jgi:uncharacterized protein (DUF433 family)
MATIETPTQVDLSPYIEHRLFGERPHLRGRRLPVWVVAYTVRDNPGITIADLTDNFTITDSEALALLLYYANHQRRD